MKKKALTLLTAAALSVCLALADETGGAAPSRHITLREAVQLALKHNHNVRIAQYGVDEKQHAKEAAKSSYFPSLRNDTSFMRLTDTQLVQIKEGSLSAPGGTPIPPVNTIINQGGRNLTTSGTQITQPLTSLLKVKQANEIAAALTILPFGLIYPTVMLREEAHLAQLFPNEYKVYKVQVPRFFPRFRLRLSGSFSLVQYISNREYKTVLGFSAALAVLIGKYLMK